MKKFVDFLILFALYITKNYITEDWSDYTKLGKIYYYIPWLIRSCIVWIFYFVLIPEYFFKQSIIYKHIIKLQNSPEYKAKLAKSFLILKF